ncbi:hypothetical protein [Egicoccus sp. AB-alg2]|uniref:hypothetical protein n=1 Tax=Egicoccus sp. AB-alg2 TaxID=3242693 RepID=UPI00359CC3D1
MEGRPTAAPRPGDPRSRGPRPAGGWRDGLWLGLAVGLAGITAFQFVRLAWVALTGELAVSSGGLVLAFLITVVWLLTIYWLVAGAWRRSVWGCPFEHTADTAAERRCPRHRMIEDPPEP